MVICFQIIKHHLYFIIFHVTNMSIQLSIFFLKKCGFGVNIASVKCEMTLQPTSIKAKLYEHWKIRGLFACKCKNCHYSGKKCKPFNMMRLKFIPVKRVKPKILWSFSHYLAIYLDGCKSVSLASKHHDWSQNSSSSLFWDHEGVQTMSLMLALCIGVNFTLKTLNERCIPKSFQIKQTYESCRRSDFFMQLYTLPSPHPNPYWFICHIHLHFGDEDILAKLVLCVLRFSILLVLLSLFLPLLSAGI